MADDIEGVQKFNINYINYKSNKFTSLRKKLNYITSLNNSGNHIACRLHCKT